MNTTPAAGINDGILYTEAIIGAALYRERFIENARLIALGKDIASPVPLDDLDRWVPSDARSINEGRSYRVWRMDRYEHCMWSPTLRITVERAEELMGSPIIRAAILAPIDEVLYPAGNEDVDWDSDTLGNVGAAMYDAHRGGRFADPVREGSFAPQGYYDPISQPDGSVVDVDDPRGK